jgi:hypothetical protein
MKVIQTQSGRIVSLIPQRRGSDYSSQPTDNPPASPDHASFAPNSLVNHDGTDGHAFFNLLFSGSGSDGGLIQLFLIDTHFFPIVFTQLIPTFEGMY